MAGLGQGSASAVPVWLAEEDLGCIICQELLDWPATLPCGHSFCRHCLEGLLKVDSRFWKELWKVHKSMKKREKNKFPISPKRVNLAATRLGIFQLLPNRSSVSFSDSCKIVVAVEKSIAEVGQKLTELVEHLVDIVRSLQNQRPLSESGPDNELSILVFSSGVDLSMASPKLLISDTAAGKIRDILQDLEEIQKKLRENVARKEASEAQTQGSLLPRLECSGAVTVASISQAQENSQKPHLPPHAHCLTRATLHPRELLSLLSGPSIQPLT
ncbi:hypothetical protein H8958_012517 [Nasalis larvatus]